MAADTIIVLICLVQGETADRAFPVRIESSRLVGELKDAVKQKKSPKFDNFAADELTLWSINVPINEYDPATLSTLLATSDQQPTKLLPASKVKKYYSLEADDEQIHVIVQPPTTTTATSPQLFTCRASLKKAKKTFNLYGNQRITIGNNFNND